MRKKVISVLLICSMLLTLLPVGTVFAADAPTSGFCGATSEDQVTWSVNEDHTMLFISGTGAMKDYDSEGTPWNYLALGWKITQIIVSEGVTHIGYNAFNGLSKVEQVTLPAGLKSIGDNAFSSCESLKMIEFPEGMELLGAGACAFCTSLTSVSLPDTITEIGIGSFVACSALTNVKLSEGLVEIPDKAFLWCENLERIDLPAGIVRIGDSAFAQCRALKTIILPDGLLEIGERAFQVCHSLTNVIIPAGVTTIEEATFDGSGLSSVTLNEGLVNIGADAFMDTNLTELYIPATVRQMGHRVAQCDTINHVYFYGDAPKITNTSYALFQTDKENTVVHYLSSMTGWTNPWQGYPAVVWDGSDTEWEAETQIVGFNPANGASNVGYDGTTGVPSFYIQFNKAPQTHGGGAGVEVDNSKTALAIYRASDNSLVWQDKDFGYGYSTHMRISTNDTIVAIEPTNAHTMLEESTEYYITMGAGYIKFADGTVSPEIKKGDWTFRTMGGELSNSQYDVTIKTGDKDCSNASVLAQWEDRWFSNSATVYMHELARTAMALCGASYVEKDGKPDPNEIQYDLLHLAGCEKATIASYRYDYPLSETDNDVAAYTFGSKTVYDNGEPYTLVAVIVKGTSGNEEWYSNFNIGLSSTHKGFQLAQKDLLQQLDTYLKAQGLQGRNLKFLVTGHSRGAAVANLVAKELTDSYGGEHVYGYTFATPTVSTQGTNVGYNNIFNIVNGEDFVTRVPLAKWNFRHYGIDRLLPSRSFYGSGYDSVYDKMNGFYQAKVGKSLETYEGTQKVDSLVQNVYRIASTVREFYNGPAINIKPTLYQYFYSLAKFLAVGEMGDFLANAAQYPDVTKFFLENHLMHPRVLSAHGMAAYCAWLYGCTEQELFGTDSSSKIYNFKRAVIACPVDVYVYDESGQLAASVVDEQVGVNRLAVSVEDGVKTVDLPGDQNYAVKVVAFGDGTVDYTVDEYQATALEDSILRTVRFDDIAIADGDVLTGNINDIVYTASRTYALTKNEKEVITADYDSMGSSGSGSSGSGGFSGTYNYPVKVDSTGDATVALDKNYAVAGDQVTITVQPKSGKAVDEVIVTDKDNKVIAVTKVGDNKYSFTMPSGQVKVAVTTKAAAYDKRIVLQINNRNVLINSTTFANDVAPVIVDDRTMVPIRVITEALGGRADWNAASQTVALTIDGSVLRMTIGQTIAGFDAAPVILNDRTYVPIRYVAEKLGANVEWIANTQQIIIEK